MGAPGTVRPSKGFWLRHLFGSNDAETAKVLEETAQRVRRERAGMGVNAGSGKTMIFLAEGLQKMRRQVEQRSHRKLRLVLLFIAGPALMTVLALSAVVFYQHRAISRLESEKQHLDGEILDTLHQMQTENEPAALEKLELRLQGLMLRAREKVDAVSRSNRRRAEELIRPEDPLERDIRRILRKFNADEYSIPPLFVERVREHVEKLRADSRLPVALARHRNLWPVIRSTMASVRLPEELGYVAFAESSFDPNAGNRSSGARGLWQLMPEVGRTCGLRIDEQVDERLNPARSTQAAACYLSNLLAEFGQESVLLVLASYNRGENGVRRALHHAALEPGGFRNRDFWHLYRLKLLPPETREYVPRVFAAAIVFGSAEEDLALR